MPADDKSTKELIKTFFKEIIFSVMITVLVFGVLFHIVFIKVRSMYSLLQNGYIILIIQNGV